MPDPMTSHTTQTTPLDRLSFESALAELEQIVRGLESGQMKLEDAISAYERGAALRRHCEERLGEAEMRVKAIVQDGDGSLSTESLGSDDTPSPAPRRKTGRKTAPADGTDRQESRNAGERDTGRSQGPGLDDEIPF